MMVITGPALKGKRVWGEGAKNNLNPKQLHSRHKNLLGDGGRNRRARIRQYHNGPASSYGSEIERLLKQEELENNDLHAQRILEHETMEFAKTVKLIRLIIEELERYKREHEHLNWQMKNK
jgi:hypothetical protein